MTSPYLAPLLTRQATLGQTIREMNERADGERRGLTSTETRTVEQLTAELETVAGQLDELRTLEQRTRRSDELAATLEQAAAGGRGEPVMLGTARNAHADPFEAYGVGGPAPALMPGREQLVELYTAAAEQRAVRVEVAGALHTRAVVEVADVGQPIVSPVVIAPREPRRIATAAGLTVVGVHGSEGAVFPVFGAGAADVVVEGAAKPEYDAITPGSATPQTIAVWTDFTRQTTLTLPGFETRLRAKHAALVAKREDALLVARVNTTTGVQTFAPTTGTYAESLLAAAALVLSSDVAAAPNLALINPTDVPRVFAGTTGRGGETPESDLRLTLHGMSVYPTVAVTAGTAIVGAWRESSGLIVGQRPTVFIDPVSGLKNNRVTMLLEEAITLGIDEPTGFVKVTFPAAG